MSPRTRSKSSCGSSAQLTPPTSHPDSPLAVRAATGYVHPDDCVAQEEADAAATFNEEEGRYIFNTNPIIIIFTLPSPLVKYLLLFYSSILHLGSG